MEKQTAETGDTETQGPREVVAWGKERRLKKDFEATEKRIRKIFLRLAIENWKVEVEERSRKIRNEDYK